MTETSSVFLEKTISQSDNNNNNSNYVSPFRDPRGASNQVAKTLKFPTTSATSDYNKLTLEQIGFRHLKGKQRVKDMVMPQLLMDNELRQTKQLKDLDDLEENMDLLKKSQSIQDLTGKNKNKTKQKKKKKEPEVPLDTRKDKTNRFAIDYDFVPPVSPPPIVVPIRDKITSDYLSDAGDIPHVVKGGDDDQSVYTIDSETRQEIDTKMELNHLKDANDMILQTKCVMGPKPIDPSKAPRVFFDEASSSLVKATPKNPELIVKLNKYGHVSKAVYDVVNYQDMIHENKLRDLKDNYHLKSLQKKSLLKDKSEKIFKQKIQVLSQINDLKLKHINDLEIIENDKIFKLFKINSNQIHDKTQILHDTEILKLMKLNQLKFQRQRQSLLQQQLNELILEQSNVQNDHQLWNQNLVESMEQIDAQLFKLKQYNYKQGQLQSSIDTLTMQKQSLQEKIDSDISTTNFQIQQTKKITLGTHDYNIKLETINQEITTKQNLLSIIKQETNNENLNLLKITNEIELAKQKREDEWNEKLNSTKQIFQTQLTEKQNELTNTLNDLREKHDLELQNLTNSYETQLNDTQNKLNLENEQHLKAKETITDLTTSKLNLEDNIKELKETNMQQISRLNTRNDEMMKRLEQQTKLTQDSQRERKLALESKHDTEVKMNYANDLLKQKLNPTTPAAAAAAAAGGDDSLFSFVSEEEIVYK